MPLIVKYEESEDFKREIIPEGVYTATCFGMYDLGTHTWEYQGKEKEQRKIMICWEVPAVRVDWETSDGVSKNMPMQVTREFTLSFDPRSHLRQSLESWRGKDFTEEELDGFDLEKIVGSCCLVQVKHGISKSTGNAYAEVINIMALPPGTEKPKMENDKQYFSFDDEFKGFPENLQAWIVDKKITESKEFKQIMSNENTDTDQIENAPTPQPPPEVEDPKITEIPTDDIPF